MQTSNKEVSPTTLDGARMSPQRSPMPLLKERPVNTDVKTVLLEQGVAPWLADVIAGRVDIPVEAESVLAPTIARIKDPSGIPDLDRAVDRIVRAIIGGEEVILAVDHDMDGTASAAVLWKSFTEYFGVPSTRLQVVTSHRLTEGYGLTVPVVERILKTSATLVVTADKGSSDAERICMLAEAGRDVIVTDHHALPIEGPPSAAYAVVNPTRNDSSYDPHICGAAVTFLVMVKIRTALLSHGYLETIPSLTGLLDYVAVATIADCVSLRPDKSYTNRALVKRGLALINERIRPCWQVFGARIDGPVTAETVAFHLAPPIAAAGRLDWAETGFRFLVADSVEEAQAQWVVLQRENEARKGIERALRERAFELAAAKTSQAIVLFFDDGHSGVHGITASRLVETFGKPAAIFAPRGAGARNKDAPLTVADDSRRLASGSFRGVPGFHVRDGLQHVADHYPGLMVGFGGHAGAAGATVAVEDIDRFAAAFEEAVIRQLGTAPLCPVIWVDGDLSGELLSLETVDALNALGPWGKDFPAPVLRGQFEVVAVRPVGDGSHLKLTLRKDQKTVPAIWFNAVGPEDSSLPLMTGDSATFVYRLTDHWYAGQRSMQLAILAVNPSNG